MKHTNKLFGIGAVAIAATAIGGGATVASQSLPAAAQGGENATLTVVNLTPNGESAFSCVIDLPEGFAAGETGDGAIGGAFTVFAAADAPAAAESAAVEHLASAHAALSAQAEAAGGFFSPAEVREGTEQECADADVHVSAVSAPLQIISADGNAPVLGGATVVGAGAASVIHVGENGEGFRCEIDVDDFAELGIPEGPLGGETVGIVASGAVAVPVGETGEVVGLDAPHAVMQSGSISVGSLPAGAFDPATVLASADELREGTAEECAAAEASFTAQP